MFYFCTDALLRFKVVRTGNIYIVMEILYEGIKAYHWKFGKLELKSLWRSSPSDFLLALLSFYWGKSVFHDFIIDDTKFRFFLYSTTNVYNVYKWLLCYVKWRYLTFTNYDVSYISVLLSNHYLLLLTSNTQWKMNVDITKLGHVT